MVPKCDVVGLEHLSLTNHTRNLTWLGWLCHPSPIKDGSMDEPGEHHAK